MASQHPHIVVGIDLGTKTTRVVVCEHEGHTPEPKIIGLGSAPTQGVRHGYIISKNDAVKSVLHALRDAERDAGIVIKHAYVAMGGISLDSETIVTTTSIERPTGEVTDRDIAHALTVCEEQLNQRVMNRHILHALPLKFHLDGEPVLGNPIGMRGKKLTVKTLFITCLEHHFEDIIEVMHEAGVQVIDVIASPLAASFPAFARAHKMAGCSLVDIGAETVSIAVFENNTIVSLDVFPIGSTDITNDIALGFQIPLEDAEQVKLGSLPKEDPKKFSRSKLDEIIRARLSDIFELIDRHLKEIKRSTLLPAGIVITGGGSSLDSLHDFAKSYLKLPIRTAPALPQSTSKKKNQDSSWYVAYGLCFLPGDSEQARFRGPSPLQQFGQQIKQSLAKTLKHLIP